MLPPPDLVPARCWRGLCTLPQAKTGMLMNEVLMTEMLMDGILMNEMPMNE
jgi:hypothetical protein